MPWKDFKIDHSHQELLSKQTLLMKKSTNDSIYRSRSNSISGSVTESDHSVEAYMIKSKKAGGYLRQILHSERCGGKCQIPNCIQTCRVLSHVVLCEQIMCTTQGCETTKKLLSHFQQCRSGQAFRGVSSSSNSSSGHGGHPCMICSIACSSSPTKVLMNPRNNTFHADEIMREDDEEADEETSFSSDEVIEFNRIPFQNNQIEVRKKAFSDFAVPTGAPRAKARSKSMNAMHIDEFSPL